LIFDSKCDLGSSQQTPNLLPHASAWGALTSGQGKIVVSEQAKRLGADGYRPNDVLAKGITRANNSDISFNPGCFSAAGGMLEQRT
jgi:hypothetical protein